jgi:exonuclease III
MAFDHGRNKKPLTRLRILSWNWNSIANKTVHLHLLTSQYSPDLVFLSETHLTPSKSLFLPGYRTYRRDRELPSNGLRAGGGVAILIRSGLPHLEIAIDISPLEAVGLTLQTHLGDVNFFSIYLPPKRSKLPTSCLQAIFRTATPTVVLGDINCKHTRWGCRVTKKNWHSTSEIYH